MSGQEKRTLLKLDITGIENYFGNKMGKHPIEKSLNVMINTLKNHNKEIIELLDEKRIYHYFPWILDDFSEHNILFYWGNECYKSSVLLGIQGYYNSAYSQLRTLIEHTLLLIYFKDHPIEANWWLNDKDYEPLKFNDLVEYVKKLDDYKIFCQNGKNILLEDIRKNYRILCSFIHGKYRSRDMSIMDYDKDRFNEYYNITKNILNQSNTLLIIAFKLTNSIEEDDKKKVITNLIPSKYIKIINTK